MREAEGLKQHELAVEFGVDPTTIRRWEKGTHSIPDAVKPHLARRFHVSIAFLMRWSDDR